MLSTIDRPEIIAKNKGIEQAEAVLLSMPQIDCPVAHYFGPNIYIREVTIPAGAMAIGHRQKFDHMNIVIKGKVAVIDKDNSVKIVEAPATFVLGPGKKAGYAIETCIWQNVYSTSETNIDKLEEMFLEKDETSTEYQDVINKLESDFREEDRKDFYTLLDKIGITEELVTEQSRYEHDQIEMPSPWNIAVSVRDSNIEGKGLFLSIPFSAGEPIAPARIGDKRTPAVRYVNHSKNPNCIYVKNNEGDIYLVAKQNISGCLGGDKGEELTADYRQALEISGLGDKLCRQ